ncbi:DUF222 domain-containing protein [Gordonia sp. CPCC 205515]|uniref:DUF222 domain-containing protein n=1 Tax=Gordonia sp. CPCC 205515 TaxID=3140791 RepID=UPI003AF33AA6
MSSTADSPQTPVWRGLPAAFLGGIDPADADEAPINDLLLGMTDLDRGHSYLAYCDYRTAQVVYDRYVAPREDTDGFVVDGFADAATRIAQTRAMTRHQAEVLLNEAVVLRDRLPDVFECLGDGVISQRQAQQIIVDTDLIDGQSYAPEVDAEIARRLRKGTFSTKALRNMVDRIIFRHDPDAVRERRKDAIDKRGVWVENRRDGTAELTAVMSAENARLAYASLAATAAARVCEHDGRTKPQRESDLEFALLTDSDFACECGRDDCAVTVLTLDDAATDGIEDAPSKALVPIAPKFVIHVVCDEATLEGQTNNPGYLDGHGVIDDEHVRELAARPDARIAPLIPPDTPMNPDGTYTLPGSLASDPYRPTTSLDAFIRIRHGVCSEPGCTKSAWECDGDHVCEFDHENPGAAGQTSSENMNPKCRPWHLLKTFSGWLDDQWRDEDGQLRTETVTPEGLVIPGEAETMEELFPGLRRIRYTASPQAPPATDAPDQERPTRTRSRTANKHARRRAERSRNRKRHNEGPEAPF